MSKHPLRIGYILKDDWCAMSMDSMFLFFAIVSFNYQ